MINQTCISLESPVEWKNALQGIKHGFAHTWENCYAMRLTTGFRTYLYCFETENVRIVCPIAEREFEGRVDIVTPFGLSGFVGNSDYVDFPRHWREFVRRRDYVCGYISLNPIFENSTYFLADELCSYNNIYVLDLTRSREELFAKLSKGRKGQLKESEKTSKLVLDKQALMDFFLANYLDFFAQKRATAAYAFAPATIETLLALNQVVLVGAGSREKIEAATVFTYSRFAADYLFNISRPEGRRHSVALLWHGVNHFKSIGIPRLNLGGGVRANDSLAQFKQRFGGSKLSLNSLKQIYDPVAYKDLCDRAGVASMDKTGYFPAYRAAKAADLTASNHAN
jgi:hypothetical protein